MSAAIKSVRRLEELAENARLAYRSATSRKLGYESGQVDGFRLAIKIISEEIKAEEKKAK